VEKLLERSEEKYDAIIGGFFLEEGVSDRLVGKLKDGGVGIWPTRSEQGQALYKLQLGREKTYLM
jgi:protein-L-isoaspartate O-methyltransferase